LAISLQLRQGTYRQSEKKLLNSNIFSTRLHAQYGELRPTNAEIGWRVWDIPSKFQWVWRLGFVKAKFHYAIQLASYSSRPRDLVWNQLAIFWGYQIPLRYPGRRPACVLCACRGPVESWSKARCEPVCDQFELSRHVEIARTCPRQVGNQVCDLDSVIEFGLYCTRRRSTEVNQT